MLSALLQELQLLPFASVFWVVCEFFELCFPPFTNLCLKLIFIEFCYYLSRAALELWLF